MIGPGTHPASLQSIILATPSNEIQLRRLAGIPHTVTCDPDAPLVVARRDALPAAVFEKLAADVLHHPWASLPNR